VVSITVLAVALGLLSAALAGSCARAKRSARVMAGVLRHAELQRNAALHYASAARRNERAIIAADVHDDSIQVVTAAVLRMERLESMLDQSVDRAMVSAVRDDLREAVNRLRRLVFDLDLDVSDDLSIADACHVLADEVADDLAIEIVVDDSRLDLEPSPSSRSLLLRNVREALTNAARHGQPARVTIRVRTVDNGTEVMVTDDGGGFDVHGAVPSGHVGVRSMRRRVERAGGRFAVESALGAGATVMSWLPTELDLRAVHQPGAHGGGDGLDAGVGAELHEDVLHMVANGVHAEEQPVRDRLT
jgi:signal transduction histidine kinase